MTHSDLRWMPVDLECAVCGRLVDRLTPLEDDDEGRTFRFGFSAAAVITGWDLEPCGHHVPGSLYALERTLDPPSVRFVYLHSPRIDQAPAPAGP